MEKKESSTTKSGNKFLVLTVSDGISSSKLRVFGDDVNEVGPLLKKGGVYVSKFSKNKKGFVNFSKIDKGGTKLKPIRKIYLAQVDEIKMA